jgi:hypothetical protein
LPSVSTKPRRIALPSGVTSQAVSDLVSMSIRVNLNDHYI